jgi:hypothetical protein
MALRSQRMPPPYSPGKKVSTPNKAEVSTLRLLVVMVAAMETVVDDLPSAVFLSPARLQVQGILKNGKGR